jgi:uncharacterized membrane protein
MTLNLDPNPTLAVSRGSPLYSWLSPFPFACFAGALLTDLAYWGAADAMWETFSVWLITAGLVMAGISCVAGLIDLARPRHRHLTANSVWPRGVITAVALVLALVNAFVHSRDGYTAVVPAGLILSALVVVILLGAAWMGRETAVYRNVGVLN